MLTYREKFRPSQFLRKAAMRSSRSPRCCAETDAAADRLASTIDLNFVRRAQGDYAPLASPEDALAYDYSPIDRERMRQNRERLFVGSPSTVRESLGKLIEETQADEADDHHHDLRSRGAQTLLHTSRRGILPGRPAC